MGNFIHEDSAWPEFTWQYDALAAKLVEARFHQGLLIGRMQAIGFRQSQDIMLTALTADVQKSSEIEGDVLNANEVRSSLARRLGIEIGALIPASRHVEGVVEMVLDATQNFADVLTADRLFGWHAAMFPSGWSGLHRVAIGEWRNDRSGPMQVVSGPMGRERVHYTAPAADRVAHEMELFFAWFNGSHDCDAVLRAALAHLWFVTIHPFEDGNGRIARAITDMALARAEGSGMRFYSMSSQIRNERSDYYQVLERTQRGSLDITAWLVWFLGCLDRAVQGSQDVINLVVRRASFWDSLAEASVNERQRRVLTKLIDGFDGNLTNKKWAAIAKCSPDTALRDIQNLLDKQVLTKDATAGRSTSYSLRAL